MVIHQCMTCGERWGASASHITSQHIKLGHEPLVGDEDVLTQLARERGVAIKRTPDVPIVIYRCFECNEIWEHDATEESYERSRSHDQLGHTVLIGDELIVRAMVTPGTLPTNTANPLDPDSTSGQGTVLSFVGKAEEDAA